MYPTVDPFQEFGGKTVSPPPAQSQQYNPFYEFDGKLVATPKDPFAEFGGGLIPESYQSNPNNIGSSPMNPKNYMMNYINSPIYKQRLSGLGAETKPQSTKDIDNTTISYNTDQPSQAFPKYTTGLPNEININPIQEKTLGASDDEVKAHEFSHVQRKLSNNELFTIYNYSNNPLLKDVKKDNIYNSKNIERLPYALNPNTEEHNANPEENKADLDALRYLMYKKGIYDTSKREMTIDDFNKALKDPEIQKSFSTKRLLRDFKPKDIVSMNNTIAYVKTPNQNQAVYT